MWSRGNCYPGKIVPIDSDVEMYGAGCYIRQWANHLFRVADQNVVVSAFLVAKMRYVLSIIDNMVLLLVGTKPGSLFVKKSSVQKSQIHIDNRNDGYVAVDKLCFG